MNEVEKLYEKAGLHKRSYIAVRFNDKIFTAEKQIYLIKFLSDKAEYLGIHYDRYKGLFEMQTDVGGLSIKNEFKEALASRVNVLWQDLTAEEQEKIRQVLSA